MNNLSRSIKAVCTTLKKTLRKILRNINKHIKYTGSSQVTVELLIYFCKSIQEAGIPIEKNAMIANLYKGQVEKNK